MNILYSKLGRSLSFNKDKWSVIGGDIEAPTLLIHLAKLHPEDTFYVITGNDIDKNETLKHKLPNIINLFCGFNYLYDNHTYVYEKIKRLGLKIDYAIIYNGITGTLNLDMKYYKNLAGEIVPNKPLIFMKRYCGPQIYAINKLCVRWCLLSPDPRYYPLLARDLNPPEINWAEYESVDDWVIRTYDTRITSVASKVKSVYNEIDTVCLMGRYKPSLKQYLNTRSDKLNIVLNEGAAAGEKGRGGELTKYVLDMFPNDDIQIYGKWADKWYADKRFKGPEKISNLTKLLINTRYTFIIPTSANWASSKFCEMVYFGIIPFMHPTYDTQKLIKCPEYIRCTSPEDFRDKIEFLENNPAVRIEILTELYNMYGNEYFTGEKVINSIYEQINRK